MGITLKYINKSSKSLKSLQKVFFCATNVDIEAYLEPITDDILAAQSNISLWYPVDEGEELTPEQKESYLSDLQEMNLFVIPVTEQFLSTDNRARQMEYVFALAHHIPVLPILQEQRLEEKFNFICGNLQCLNKFDPDPTALPYEEKLKLFLDTVLLKDETIEKIRKAFAAYIFLSYRKKDRKYAQEVMRLIHKNPFTRDIAIWYDEFLTPGEDFNESIKAAFEKSGLFSMVVTPSLLETPNYVMTIEYPMAVESGKTILPIMAVPTDNEKLEKYYPAIPERVTSNMDNAGYIEELIRQALDIRQDDDPEHKFFMGLAYLSGIDLETDYEKAKELITDAAENDVTEACLKLVSMYENGQGVKRDYEQGAIWQERYVDGLEKKLREGSKEKNLRFTYFNACVNSGKKWRKLYQYDKAWAMCQKVIDADVKDTDYNELIVQISACTTAYKIASNQKDHRKAEMFLHRGVEISRAFSDYKKRAGEKKKGGLKRFELLELLYRASFVALQGNAKSDEQNWDEAIVYYKEAIPIYEELLKTPQLGRRKPALADVYQKLGLAIYKRDTNSQKNRKEAERYLLKSLSMIEECKKDNLLIDISEIEASFSSWTYLVVIYATEGRLDEAETIAAEYLKKAEEYYEEKRSVLGEHALAGAYAMNSIVAEKRGDHGAQAKWIESSISIEEKQGKRVGMKNVARQLRTYYKTLLKILREEKNWEKHRLYTERFERLVLECYPNDSVVITELAFSYSRQKDASCLEKAYKYYDRSLELNPENKANQKNLEITEKLLGDVIRQLWKEQNNDELQKLYSHFYVFSEEYPEKEGIARIRDKAEEYLAIVLSMRQDIPSKEKACEHFHALAERHPEIECHANNLRIVKANIANKYYSDAKAGDKEAAKRAYELYTLLGRKYPDKGYGKIASYVKDHLM